MPSPAHDPPAYRLLRMHHGTKTPSPAKHGTWYAFDLDGTITTHELLPLMARELGLHDEIALLTRLTLAGAIPFDVSFRLRFAILRSIPLPKMQQITARASLDPVIEAFIHDNRDCCAIVTGNVDLWILPLVQRLGCRYYASTATIEDNGLVLTNILDKGLAIRDLEKRYGKVIAVGESCNDIAMFEAAYTGIAYGGVHPPAPQLLRVADYAVDDAEALCALLRKLQANPPGAGKPGSRGRERAFPGAAASPG